MDKKIIISLVVKTAVIAVVATISVSVLLLVGFEIYSWYNDYQYNSSQQRAVKEHQITLPAQDCKLDKFTNFGGTYNLNVRANDFNTTKDSVMTISKSYAFTLPIIKESKIPYSLANSAIIDFVVPISKSDDFIKDTKKMVGSSDNIIDYDSLNLTSREEVSDDCNNYLSAIKKDISSEIDLLSWKAYEGGSSNDQDVVDKRDDANLQKESLKNLYDSFNILKVEIYLEEILPDESAS